MTDGIPDDKGKEKWRPTAARPISDDSCDKYSNEAENGGQKKKKKSKKKDDFDVPPSRTQKPRLAVQPA